MMKTQNKIKNLAEYFIQSYIKFPERPALIVGGIPFTYQRLFELASRLASLLVQFDANQCALLCGRGIDSYVGLLASLMAGKTYVPLSIKNPEKRNLQILKYSQAKILILDRVCMREGVSLLQNCENSLNVVIPDLFQLPPELESLPHKYVMPDYTYNNQGLTEVLSQEDAYLLFTSGSTGSPKAVMTSHPSIIEYIEKMTKRYQPNEFDRFSQLTDLGFDVAMHEVFLCWASGASLYVITDNQLPNLHRLIDKHQLTFWTSVPSTISLLKQWNRLAPGIFPSIRYSSFLGEPLAEELVYFWHQVAPNSQIENLYGPTEATIIFTGYRWQPEQPHSSGYVPIGKPLEGQFVALLDECFCPVPIGQVGELYLAGSQVAKGYWKNSKLTHERFLKLNLPGFSNELLWYRTGDFVYYDDKDGLIFKGRESDIFKVRGSRVERLEVEAILRTIANTDVVAVIPDEHNKDGVAVSMIAFVGYSLVDDHTILKQCRYYLPEYMIPAKIIRVESLPVNKNGKVDYQHLKQVRSIIQSSVKGSSPLMYERA